jgi:hypothetical protein
MLKAFHEAACAGNDCGSMIDKRITAKRTGRIAMDFFIVVII